MRFWRVHNHHSNATCLNMSVSISDTSHPSTLQSFADLLSLRPSFDCSSYTTRHSYQEKLILALRQVCCGLNTVLALLENLQRKHFGKRALTLLIKSLTCPLHNLELAQYGYHRFLYNNLRCK